MDDGIHELEKGESIPRDRALSPLSLGFQPPSNHAGLAGDRASIRTPTSPRTANSVTFSDTVQVKGAEGDMGRKDKDKKKKDDGHTVRFGFIPPRGVVGKVLTRVLALLVWYGVLWGIFGNAALPAFPPDATPPSSECNESNESMAAHCNNFNFLFNLSCPSHYTNETPLIEVISDKGKSASVYEMAVEDECHGVEECVQGCLCQETHHETHDFFDIPEGHFFGLFMLTIVSAFFGFLAHIFRLPHLFGMMVGGILLNNLPVVGVARNISHEWSDVIRTCALVIVLIRGGLSMDEKALRRLFLPVAALGVLPSIFEATAIFLVTCWWTYNGRWEVALEQGFLNAAISPSVLVPSLLNLEDHGYGVDKGIPTMLIVSAAFDDVICISLFGVFLALVFQNGPLVFSIFRGPIEVVIGLLYGVGFGLTLWYVPSKDSKKGSIVRNRLTLLVGLALFAFFGAKRMVFYNNPGFIGAGALSILTVAFVASIGWKRGRSTKHIIDRTFFILWQFIEPLLFGLIGAEVNIAAIDGKVVGQAVAAVLSGLSARVLVVFLITLPFKFNWKERLFICISWLPKATIQAAISGYPLQIAQSNGDCQQIIYARIVQTIAIFEIVVAAPIGALLIGLLGPRLLTKSGPDLREEERNQKTEEEIEKEQWIADHPDEVNMDHYHDHHHHDLFEIHDPIPEVIHWSETHCLGCSHTVMQWIRGKNHKGEYELEEPRTPRRNRRTLSGSSPASSALPSPVGYSPSDTFTPNAGVHSYSNPEFHERETSFRERPARPISQSPLIHSASSHSTSSASGGVFQPPNRNVFQFPSVFSEGDENPNVRETGGTQV